MHNGEDTAREPGTAEKWLVTLFIVPSTFSGFFLTAVGPLKTMLARDLQVPETQLIFLASAYGFATLIAALLAPWALARGVVWPLRISPILALIGVVALIAAPGVPAVLVAASTVAMGCALLTTSISVAFTGPRAVRNQAVASGIASVMSVVSTLAFSLLDSFSGVSGRWALLIMVPSAVAAIFLAWRTPVDYFDSLSAQHATLMATSVPPGAGELSGTSVVKGLGNAGAAGRIKPDIKKVLLMSLRLVLAISGEFVVYGYSVNLLINAGASVTFAAFLATGFAAGMAVGRILLGSLISQELAIVGFSLLSAGGFAAAGFADNYWLIAGILFVLGIGVSATFPITIIGLNNVKHLPRTRISQLFGFISAISALGAPLLFGYLTLLIEIKVLFIALAVPYILLALLPRH